jgi:hypothetical protein
LQNNPSDRVLRRVLSNVCGFTPSKITSTLLAEFRKYGLTLEKPFRPKVRVVNAQEFKSYHNNGSFIGPPPVVYGVALKTTDVGCAAVSVNDPETTDGFTRIERKLQNDYRPIGENEEPEVSEAVVVSDIEEENEEEADDE